MFTKLIAGALFALVAAGIALVAGSVGFVVSVGALALTGFVAGVVVAFCFGC